MPNSQVGPVEPAGITTAARSRARGPQALFRSRLRERGPLDELTVVPFTPLHFVRRTPALEFLDETQPTPALLPGDLHGRARVRSIASMLAADTHPLITPRVKKYLTATGGFDDAAWRAWQVQWFGTGLAAVEQRLAGESETGTFCHGEQPTFADICLASIVVMTRIFKIDVPSTPTIDRIMAACDAHEAFVKADPRRQKGASASA